MASPFPIEVIPLSLASCGSLLWRVEGTLRATVIVKATFALTHEGDATPIEPAPIARRDRYRSSLAPSSLDEARDTMPYLPGAGVVLHGHACAPKGEPQSAMAVRLIVAREEVLVDKTLHVFGDRTPEDADHPAPFTRIPLVYERAYGGLFAPENPLGTGGSDDGTPPPNIVDPNDPQRPAGFGPLPSHHPTRRQWLAPAERERVEKSVPELPDGFDGRYFHAAPKDQQTGFLRGDEWILLEGMHPDHPRLQARLPFPQAHAQWHLVSEQNVGPPRSLGLFADTLIIDADRLVASIVWRGHFPLDDERDVLRARVFAGIAYPDNPIHWPAPGQIAEVARKLRAESGAHHAPITMPPPGDKRPGRRERSQTLTDDQTADSPPIDLTPFQIAPPSLAEPKVAAAIPGAPFRPPSPVESAPAETPLTPPAPPDSPAMTAPTGGWPAAPERLAPPLDPAAEEPKRSLAVEPPAHLGSLVPAEPPKAPGLREKVMDLLLEGASLDGMDLAGADLSKLDFSGRSLAKCHLKGSLLQGAIFASANLTGARMPDVDLTDADLSGADLTRANLMRAKLVRARFDGATLSETNLTSAEGREASFQGASGSRPTFARSQWQGAVFAQMSAQNADFSGATLDRADFRGAKLPDLRLDGATAACANLNDATLPKAHAQGATLTDCSLVRVDAPGSVWEQATLTGSTFQAANLKGASFVKASCTKVDFSDATLSEARLRQADLSHADLGAALLDGAKMQRAKGDGANLKGARLDGADLRQATMPGASFADVTMHKGWADNADLTGARFSGADLKKTSLRAATLVGASFAHADLEGVDMRDADLTGANLVGASRQGAKMQGADLTDVREIEPDAAEVRASRGGDE